MQAHLLADHDGDDDIGIDPLLAFAKRQKAKTKSRTWSSVWRNRKKTRKRRNSYHCCHDNALHAPTRRSFVLSDSLDAFPVIDTVCNRFGASQAISRCFVEAMLLGLRRPKELENTTTPQDIVSQRFGLVRARSTR